MGETISITVNGNTVSVDAGQTLLEAVRGLGVEVPTLCHHPSLDPSGACRLCVVEITHPDWGGWSGLVTSCLYPVEPGLVVSTVSSRVHETRRTLLELYLARCPDSEEVKAIARREGVNATPYPDRPEADTCIQCGLCVRVCNELSTAAIAPLGRGTDKTVGPRPDDVGEDCVGCLACGEICPTGYIEWSRGDGTARIWNRDFALPVAEVTESDCRGCGSCEEACPFAIPRVVVRRGGLMAATISPHTCTGCGICAGACPTGAITQKSYPDAALTGAELGDDLRGRVITYACDRSAFRDGTDVVPVPCVGRVGVDEITACLARGADGVQLMCRDRDTCPYGDGGRRGEAQAVLADELAELVGLGAGRVAYTRPRPGIGGPDEARADFREDMEASPLEAPCIDDTVTGLDRTLALLKMMAERPELSPAGSGAEFETALLDRLLEPRIDGWRLAEAAADFSPGAGLLDEADRGAFRFRISPEQRRDMIDRLRAAPADAGCATLEELAQVKLLTRPGSWLEGIER